MKDPKITPPACEIITIGSELLLGQIMDTNTAYLARKLSEMGVRILFRTAVGDHLDEIVEVIDRAVQRSDMVITTGGLGPTLDDLTREAVSRVAGVGLEFRQDLMDQIEALFKRVGYRMPDNNRRQAFVPEGSRSVPNPVGTAPAFIKEVKGKPIICLPGVPRELEYLLVREIMPWLRDRFNLPDHAFTYRVLKVVGIGESKVDQILGDLIRPGENPEVGLLASMGEIKIRIAARAGDTQQAESIIEPVEEEIRRRLGDKIFGQDEETLESVVDSMLEQRGLTLVILETFTGGTIALRFHRIPSPHIMESRVVPLPVRLTSLLGNEGDGKSDTRKIAGAFRDRSGAGAALAVVGFPEKKGGQYYLKGNAAAVLPGGEKVFSWEMGGDLPTLQQRGAVIGLNTLRLALMDRN